MTLPAPTSAERDGLALYGDTFTQDQIDEWFADEAQAYVELYASNPDYEYEYEQMNVRHGFRHLPETTFEHALGLGSAYGDELLPISDRIENLSIVESSDEYATRTSPLGCPVSWIPADATGVINRPDASVDLVVCFGVLHHIPNVSKVVQEIARVSKPGAWILIREPVISMGDFTSPRPGLTPHERGISHEYLRDAFERNKLAVRSDSPCFFSGVAKLAKLLRQQNVYQHSAWVKLDDYLSRAFLFNTTYASDSWWTKIRPTSRFYVLRKSQAPDRTFLPVSPS